MRVLAKPFCITPRVHLLQAVRNRDNMDYRAAISELVDNSFGPAAGDATEVHIVIRPTGISVHDNGRGINDIQRLFTLGDSESRHHATDVGQYGYGAKSACIWLADRLRVETCTGDRKISADIDWTALMERDAQEWPTITPKIELVPEGSPSYTHIHADGLCQKKRISIESIARELGETYEPALKEGRRIILHNYRKSGDRSDIEVQPFSPAGWTDIHEFSGEVGGKKYSCSIGVLTSSVSHFGLRLCYGHRLIDRLTKLDGTALPVRVFGYVRLSPDWKRHLAANKTEVKDTDELEVQIAEKAKGVIIEAERKQRRIKLDELNAKFSTAIGERIVADPAGPLRGTRKPTNEGKRTKTVNPVPPLVQDQDSDKPASEVAAETRKGLELRMDACGQDSPVAVVSADDTGLTVTLNEDAPLMGKVISEHMASGAGLTAAFVELIGYIIAGQLVLNGDSDMRQIFGNRFVEFDRPHEKYEEFMKWWNGNVTEAVWKDAER